MRRSGRLTATRAWLATFLRTLAGEGALAAVACCACSDVTSDLITRAVVPSACLESSDCADDRPECDATSGRCVECLARAHCPSDQTCSPNGTCIRACGEAAPCAAAEPICDAVSGLCRGCASNDQCAPATPRCNVESGRCVECFVGSDCAERDDVPFCENPAGRCVECITEGHCTEAEEDCNSVVGECSQPCTQAGQCPEDDPICDLSMGFCVECRNDVDCGPGAICRRSDCTPAP